MFQIINKILLMRPLTGGTYLFKTPVGTFIFTLERLCKRRKGSKEF